MIACPGCSRECDEEDRFCGRCGFPIGEVSRSPDDPLLGKTLPGGYVLLELIGVGGMGRVYRGEQQALGRTVAVKVVHHHLLGDDGTAARFITEARAASRLNHPNSVSVIDFGRTSEGQPYLVMEFLRGRDLARLLFDDGILPIPRALDIVRQVLLALGEAHELGIVHRDVKPENIIVEAVRGGGDFVKVVDFGLAKLLETGVKGPTRPGLVCGTPEYMAPEQGRGEPLDARADLYAVGVILYLLLTGRLPFDADSPTQVVLMHITLSPPDPRLVAPERAIPDELADVCLKALAKAPAERFASADAFIAALDEAKAHVTRTGAPSSERSLCAACGHPNPPGQRFCGDCGAKIAPKSERDAVTLAEPRPRRAAAPSPTRLPLPLPSHGDDLAWVEDRLHGVGATASGARLVGEEGVGKSHLFAVVAERARKSGDRVATTGPDPFWAEVGYAALARLITELASLPPGGGSLADWQGASTEARHGLTEVFHGREGPRGADAIKLETQRYVAAEALRWALARAAALAGTGRVLALVDDLHRMDGPSRNAIADALGEPPAARALIVGAHVPGFDAGWGSSAAARVLVGVPLGLAASLLKGRAAPIGTPATEARGVSPLFLEHIVRFAAEGGREPPHRLADLLALRVERTPPGARRVLQAIAVLGDAAGRDDVLRLAPGEHLEETLLSLAASGLVDLGDDRLRVTHPLLREVVLANAPAAVRRQLHAVALSLAEEAMLPLEVCALHAVGAQDSSKALPLLERAAATCSARGDTGGAIMQLRRGLDLARREIFRGEIDDPTRAVALFGWKLGEALTAASSFTDADGVLREALDIAPHGPEKARIHLALARVAALRERLTEAGEHLRRAESVAAKVGARDVLSDVARMRQDIAP